SPAAPAPASPSNPTEPSIAPCTPEVAAAAFEVIRSQQRAFAASDYAAARRLASTDFRSGVTLHEFEAIIEGGYGFLLDDPEVALTECRMVGPVAVLRISVQADPPVGLAYRLVPEDGDWRIDGASKLQEVRV
ncbi:MAG: DUF4864 domain-containing protein, partial [Actinomycetales bacterium]